MTVEIKIPDVAESITEVTIATWLKQTGDYVALDEALCEVETDKATQELFAEASGILEILVEAGETVDVGAVIARINTNGTSATPSPAPAAEATPAPSEMASQPENNGPAEIIEMRVEPFAESITEVVIGTWLKAEGDFVEMDEGLCEVETDKATQELPATASGILHIVAPEGSTLKIGDLICKIEKAASGAKATTPSPSPSPAATSTTPTSTETSYATGTPSPAAAKILAEKGIDPTTLKGTGIEGRITKEDALKAEKPAPAPTPPSPSATPAKTPESPKAPALAGERAQTRKRMSQLRKTIARRLVAVKNETAMLTTFNEASMQPIMDLRNKYKEAFKEKHKVGLGFMSFFAKACAQALMEIPEVNAQIDDNEIVYHNYVDLSVAVSTERGLVVPVLRNVEKMSFAEIEQGIVDLAVKARDGKLAIEDMQGGTFTITNGGIFGSMMSTPIINAPQSAILGMHNIIQRPMAVNGEVKILPMMYLALSYDHRIIDGKEAVTFLVTVKKYLEEPERLLFGV
ncbi:MAG: 2-oxoglutarate dehydrogenase complex dihydrolipoyllysine-residue succinyltransferase [Microscillaceae bacterium]